ncbi:ABC transporter substrate-binding protein [Pseudonocardia acaciae]|uniref:ABC transporter substrate-binding protein n=1 Tax=Pseudonocardia acaciae TaxID=551276 RepID=UPI0004901B1A|nr:ABC transporter substrate-binding protein [Pseudonocardia acaciae]
MGKFEQPSGVSRRVFLAAAAVGVVAGPGLLAACGRGPGDAAGGDAGPPRRGGALRVGMVGGGQVETLNVNHYTADIGITRQRQLFDVLVGFNPDMTESVPVLAEEFTPDKDLKVWTARLRRGVTFHNGKDFTADDVLHTIRGWTDRANDAYAQIGKFIDLPRLRKRDSHTVELPFTIPFAEPHGALASPPCMVYQDGEKDFTKPAGTGPFKLTAFTPGQSSTMVRNENYWAQGKPYVDELRIISFSDATAAFNALQGGQTDLMPAIPFAQARALKQGGGRLKLMVTPQPSSTMFSMATNQPPFDDVRVRQAMRLIVDRQALVDTVFFGFGEIGNDLPGPGLPHYDTSVPQRTRDIERAKALLKEAGKENLTVTLHTNQASPGLVEAAQLFAEQAKAAGVTVTVKQENPSAYYDPSQLYLKMPFYQENNSPISSLASICMLDITQDGPFNGTHWKNPASDAVLFEAIGSTGPRAQELWSQVQRQQHAEGGYIMWGQANFVDAMAKNVHGLPRDKFANAGNWAFKDVWLG